MAPIPLQRHSSTPFERAQAAANRNSSSRQRTKVGDGRGKKSYWAMVQSRNTRVARRPLECFSKCMYNDNKSINNNTESRACCSTLSLSIYVCVSHAVWISCLWIQGSDMARRRSFWDSIYIALSDRNENAAFTVMRLVKISQECLVQVTNSGG